MFGKIKTARPYNLLPLMVMLYITVGMPLVHPLMHSHWEHDQSMPADGGHHLQDPTAGGKDHHCPICDFETTNPMHAAACNTSLAGHEFIDDFVFFELSFCFKACPQIVDARAPPALPAII
jgi:hypothetical protein